MHPPFPQRNGSQRKSLRMGPGEKQCLIRDGQVKRSLKGDSVAAVVPRFPSLSPNSGSVGSSRLSS